MIGISGFWLLSHATKTEEVAGFDQIFVAEFNLILDAPCFSS